MFSYFKRALAKVTKRYLLHQDEREALRRRLGSQISARENESDVLDYVTAELALVFSADAVTWEPLMEDHVRGESAVIVPTTHEPRYQLKTHGLNRGRYKSGPLPLDVVELMEYAARLLGRQLDLLRAGEYQNHTLKRTSPSQVLFVTLGFEIERVREQFATMLEHLKLDMQITIDVPEQLLSVKIPPYLIQPIVDNAVRHGIVPQGKGGRIMINSAVHEREFVISVSDTGDGFVPSNNNTTGSLSQLRNRLTEYYGCEAGMRIDSLAGYGTTVSINLPHRPHHLSRQT